MCQTPCMYGKSMESQASQKRRSITQQNRARSVTAKLRKVSRGAKLRERKFGPPSDVTAKYSKPPLPARVVYKDRRKPSPSPCRNNGLDQLRERARSNSPFQSSRMSSPLSRRDSSSTYSRRCRPVCSMRISELAVPTKRQCIDTWRNKAGILPGQMVNRLKQQVMDQTPIVKISDAVNCFSQSSSVTSKKRLQNISSIISGEICDILRDKTKLQIDVTIHERMVRETADKVTIWIANILEETSEKLLEEDLKELEEQEGPALDILDDLVDNVVTVCRGADSDLEDIFDAASSLQKSEDGDNDVSTTDYVSVSSGNNDDTDSKAKSPVQEALKEYLDESDKKPIDDEESLKNHLMKQLNEIIDTNVIDTLKSHDILEKNSKEFDKHTDSQSNMQANRPGSVLLSVPDYKNGQMDIKLLVDEQEYDRDQISLEKERSPSDEALNQSDKADSGSEKEAKFDESLASENNNNDAVETKAQSDKIDEDKEDTIFLLADDQVRDNIDEQKLNMNEEQKSNLNEDQKSVKSAELPEDRDKKVQFSYDNFGEVDEPWPEDLSFETLIKPGESVSKSVTSLGRILESDERNWLSPEETSSGKDQGFTSNPHPESIEQLNNFGINYDDFLGDNDNDGDSRNDKQSTAIVKVLDEFSRNDLNDVAPKQPQYNLKDTIEVVSDETDGQYGPTPVIKTVNQEETMSQTRDGTLGVSKLNPKKKVEQQELTAQIKGVHPSTAPSWIRRGRGQGDLGACPRPQGYTGTDGMRERELEIRKRCKDLDKILTNLEKWKSWLEYITKYITSLKEKAELNKPTLLHTNKAVKSDREKPARSTEKDAIWTKLNHRAKGGLKLSKNNETIKFKVQNALKDGSTLSEPPHLMRQPCAQNLPHAGALARRFCSPSVDKTIDELGVIYWDLCYDLDLMIDRVSLDLLYLQTIEELDLGWVTAEPHIKDILKSYEEKKQKREVDQSISNGHRSQLEDSNKNYELSFEYLISKDNLKWITLRTEHATFISVCLQSIVDELMRQKGGAGPGVRARRAALTYLRRDGSSHVNGDSYNSGSSREIFSVQKLTEKFASVAFKSGKDCVENNAFEAIGDEEL
ncbi:hypothetical protein MSG28_011160 [Choristoneura fumiferana]|uniref:Uncharacterized protein n=1 Tax=Choristoneura fumiferana TaxID=7141 RepID=A0ACC0KQF1_CHOFU|nr:hypothetical protein MSG28_011160 [Choristoneura fumiferana]